MPDHPFVPPRRRRPRRHRQELADRDRLPRAVDELELGVVTNDIYTDEDARFLRSEGVLDADRIRAVETGACPHTAIRDDVTPNLIAVETLEADHAPLDVVLVESGGDNLTATFSPALVDAQIFVLDVAGGGDVARKGGPGHRPRRPAGGQQDRPRAVRRRRRRRRWWPTPRRPAAGKPVLALSRTDPESVAWLADWVRLARRRGTRRPAHPRRPRPDGAPCPQPPALRWSRAATAVRAAPSPRDRSPFAGCGRLPTASSGWRWCRPAPCCWPATRCGSGWRVDGPVTVEIVETAGTVAYDMRGGSARWDVDLVLSGGARVAWHGEPFVVSSGADVDRRTTASVAADCVLALRETLVFGRSGQTGGTLRTRTRIDLRRRAGARRGPRPVAGRPRMLDHPARPPLPRLGHHRRRPPARRSRRTPGRRRGVARPVPLRRGALSEMPAIWAAARPRSCLGSGHDRLGTAVPRRTSTPSARWPPT